MKILIFFAVHKRLNVLRVCLEGIERLKKYKPEIFEISSLAVCSSIKESDLCYEYNCEAVTCNNNPLGKKKNLGIRACLTQDFDYLLEIGSDDLIHESLLDDYLPLMQAGEPVFGVNQCTFFETLTGRSAQWTNDFVIGAGRMFSRKTLETVGELWDNDRMRSLDCNSWLKLAEKGYNVKTVDTQSWKVLDIKSGDNLNGFEWFDPMVSDYDVLQHYPYEREMIRGL